MRQAEQSNDGASIGVTFVTADGRECPVRAMSGASLMEAAIEYGVPGIEADCGGSCACATCHVYVDPEWFGVVGEPSEMESGTLYFGADRRPTSRLSCQVVITPEMEGMRVTVAPYS